MKISKKMTLMALGLFAVIGLSQIASEMDADARAGGGRSGGFRGSRSYQAPSRPSQPAQPRRDATPPPQQPGQFGSQSGGFMRGLGTAVLGGFLGSMLFSGLAGAGGFGGIGGLGGSGFGMFEILLVAGIGYFLYRKFRSPAAAATGYGTMQYQNPNYQANTGNQPSYGYRAPETATLQETPSGNEVDYRSLTMMDRSFDPNQFLKIAQDTFFKVQGAWNKQDSAALNRLCGTELMQSWQEELSRLSARGQQNRMENIALSSSEITEAWTESGQDFITVRLNANLLDYTVERNSGAVVSGSDAEPIQFEEYWTFSRPVGPNAWKLTAVQQA
jgi:predicted lipid-binding transport protein (Tim44 family)